MSEVKKYSQDLQKWIKKDLTSWVGNLEGKWLTIIDATFVDKQQRKAMKDIVRKMIWDWDQDIIKDICEDIGCYAVDPNGRPSF